MKSFRRISPNLDSISIFNYIFTITAEYRTHFSSEVIAGNFTGREENLKTIQAGRRRKSENWMMSEHTEPGRVRVTESVMICHFPLHHSSLLTPHLRARHTSHTETQSVLSSLINNCHNWRDGGTEGGREVA